MAITIGSFTLRAHQERTIELVRQAVAECFRDKIPARVLIQAPCAAGKTVISSALFHAALEKGKRPAFMVSGRQLVTQKCRKLDAFGIPHSVMMGGEEYYHSAVTVCSFHAYLKRVEKMQTVSPVAPDLWVMDECQNFKSDLAKKQVEDAKVVIGLSGTPCDGQTGKGLGWWTKLVIGTTHEELLRLGYICPPRIFAPFCPDLSQLKIGDNEWSEQAVAKIYDQRILIGDVVRDWIKLGENRLTACFGSNVAHSIALRDEFREKGIPAEHIDKDTEQDERDDIFARTESGKNRIICNFGVLTVGWDMPCVSCIDMAFATNSLVKFLQVTGRGLRGHPGKKDCIIIDHGANVDRHGWPTEDRDWSLNPESKMRESDEQRRKEDHKPREPICCPKCGAMRESGPKCLNCGHKHVKSGLKMRMQDGTLKEIKRRKPKRVVSDKQKSWMRCLAVCARKGYSYSAACQMYVREFGRWPEADGVKPTAEAHARKTSVALLWPGFVRGKKQETQANGSPNTI